MSRVSGYGISVDPPQGWEVSIYERPGDPASTPRDGVTEAGTANPVLHMATKPLVHDRGDYGSGVVEGLGPEDTFLALVEFDREAASSALFAKSGVPRRVVPRSLNRNTLQRVIAGQGGLQAFANEEGRAFCLYVVVGSIRNREAVVERINAALVTLEIAAR